MNALGVRKTNVEYCNFLENTFRVSNPSPIIVKIFLPKVKGLHYNEHWLSWTERMSTLPSRGNTSNDESDDEFKNSKNKDHGMQWGEKNDKDHVFKKVLELWYIRTVQVSN